MSISAEFDLFADSLPLEELRKVLELPMNKDDTRLAAAYVICRQLEGINICFPKKAHKNEFAKLLLDAGANSQTIAQNLEVHIRTINRIQREHK